MVGGGYFYRVLFDGYIFATAGSTLEAAARIDQHMGAMELSLRPAEFARLLRAAHAAEEDRVI